MLLTLITSTFNSEASLSLTFDSVLKQQISNLEYIVIDGASTDTTLAIIEAYKTKFEEANISFKWKSEKDNGIYQAWNRGLELATGDYVAFVGSDDQILDGALRTMLLAIESNLTADFYCAKAALYKEDLFQRNFGEAFSWSTFKKEMKILHAGSFINKNYFREFGKFDETYKIVGDYELLMRKGENLKVVFVDETLIKMDAGGVSSTHIVESLKEVKKAKIKNKIRSVWQATLDFYLIYVKIKLSHAVRKLKAVHL